MKTKFIPYPRWYIIVLFALLFSEAYGQTISLGAPLLNDLYRREQLLGNVGIDNSFMARPLFLPETEDKGCFLNNPAIRSILYDSLSFGKIFFPNNKGGIALLPFTWKSQYTTDHPEGINDGLMIPARGYQTLVTGGFYARYGWLSIQFQPEYVWAENRSFDGFADEHPNNIWRSYYSSFLRNIDIPERFGDEAYQRFSLGQSSIRLTAGPVSLGLSNENLWWGPGMQNALLMTNNAPGFLHLTLNTVRPIKTIIGSFEGQLIAGRLEKSGFPNIDTLRLALHGVKYVPKPDDWRYINGLVISYQPRWLPGLFLGASRAFINYRKSMGENILNYLPVILPITKREISESEEWQGSDDQLASVFLRLVAPKDHLEVWMEYG
ncbi:MAG TPA: capsule assembly Wzi family protein, partial [Prolixibacteraceae bacterium]|nr:capsule assembly Wzi family protein [Prolixibacteraceae bacterium]